MAISSFLQRCLLCAALCMPTMALRAAAPSGSADSPTPALSRVGDYPLPGRATRWDYMSLDAPGSRLFIAHLGDSAVVVVDTKDKSIAGVIPGVSAVHGVLALPELGRAYATATGRHEVVAIDLATLKTVDHIPAGSYPDGLAYAPDAHKLYVSDEGGNSETVIDVRSGRRVAAIPLGGSAGNTQYDPASRHIFVNVQSRSELVEIDPATDAVVRRMLLHGAAGNHGLLIEARRRLAFIACEGNGKLLVLDLRTGRVAAAFDVGGDPDVLAYDEGLGVLYVATESGVLHRFSVADDGVAKLGEVRVGANAHTVAVDPATHEVFLPLKEAGKPPVLRVMAPRR
jgi:DNA-binding beta-propeller fold protein YncE